MRSLFRLKHYLRPFLGYIIASSLLALPLAAFRLGPVPLVKYVVDDLLVTRNPRSLAIFPLIVIGLFVLNFVVRFFHYYLLRVVVIRVNQRIKNDLYEHLLGLSADYFTAQSTGSLISRIGNDPHYIDLGVSSINTVIREPITFVLLFAYTLHTNWKMTLMILILLPPLAWVFSASGRNLKRYIAKMTEENAKLYSVIQESFTGIRVIKTFRLEKYVRRKFRERAERYCQISLKSAAMEEAAHPMVELLTAFVLALMIWYGGSQVLNGSMTPGDLLAFFAAFALMLNPLRVLNEVNIKLHQSAAACDRIFEVLSWKPTLRETFNPVRVSSFERELEVKNVSFAYPDAPERPVLTDVSFTLPRRQVLALVGASGAGKSSLVSLLPRIFDVTAGSITIDGKDIRDIAIEDLRSLIAVVSQDVFLFNDTIEENIRCGRLTASREEIREAARRAHALDFIEASPQGFQTVIGDRGQKLSGGERQRLSIARAFLRESPILILDEATSSLDTASERAVQAALDELMKDRTTLIIAHRLSTIRHADQILVLKDGVVLERGTHDELMARRGEYAKFHQ